MSGSYTRPQKREYKWQVIHSTTHDLLYRSVPSMAYMAFDRSHDSHVWHRNATSDEPLSQTTKIQTSGTQTEFQSLDPTSKQRALRFTINIETVSVFGFRLKLSPQKYFMHHFVWPEMPDMKAPEKWWTHRISVRMALDRTPDDNLY